MQDDVSFMIEESDNMLFANQQRLDDYDNDQPSVIHSFYEYPTLMLKNPDDSVISLNDTIQMITLTNQDKPPSFQEVSVFRENCVSKFFRFSHCSLLIG